MITATLENGANGQILHIPKSLTIDDDRVYVKKMGDVIYIIPYHKPWQSLFNSLEGFSPDFMDERSQPNLDTRDSL